MAGKVFISCGMATRHEKDVAEAVRTILGKEFHLSPYVAFRTQSLSDIMQVTRELRSSDYYLFIDFLRKPSGGRHPKANLPISLFTHQELALAYHLGFEDMIAFQQKGTPMEGFLRYVLSNPEPFRTEADLLKKLRTRVKDKGWSASFSRNLVVQGEGFRGPLAYSDHTGSSYERIWYLRVENNRPDISAVECVCILDCIERADGTSLQSPDRGKLKWVGGLREYEHTILPRDYGEIDLFAIRADRPGLFLHSNRDTPREPVVTEDGEYRLKFKLFATGFPYLDFTVAIGLRWSPPSAPEWALESTAGLDDSPSPPP